MLLVIVVGAMSYAANYIGWTAIILLLAVTAALIVWFLVRRTTMRTPEAKDLFAGLQRVPLMSGSQFELFVAEVLRALGYKTTVLGGAGDQGVDVIATAGNERLAVQCKNYRKRVGNKPVQEVYAGSRHHGCTAAWVVAPEGFTKGAVELARSVGVTLHDVQSLRGWIRQIDRTERKQANLEPSTVDRGPSETKLENSAGKKHTVKVGVKDGSVGETVTFAADLLGTANVNDGEIYYTYYRLLDGTFRVLMEANEISMLVPSNMAEAISSGQRNNFSYGRMTLEEMKAHEYDFWPGYEGLMENNSEPAHDRVRDID